MSHAKKYTGIPSYIDSVWISYIKPRRGSDACSTALSRRLRSVATSGRTYACRADRQVGWIRDFLRPPDEATKPSILFMAASTKLAIRLCSRFAEPFVQFTVLSIACAKFHTRTEVIFDS